LQPSDITARVNDIILLLRAAILVLNPIPLMADVGSEVVSDESGTASTINGARIFLLTASSSLLLPRILQP